MRYLMAQGGARLNRGAKEGDNKYSVGVCYQLVAHPPEESQPGENRMGKQRRMDKELTVVAGRGEQSVLLSAVIPGG